MNDVNNPGNFKAGGSLDQKLNFSRNSGKVEYFKIFGND